MKLNNRGMTMMEIIVSIALISIVILFLMNLFVSVRGTYNQSKTNSEYEVLVSNIINAISKDIEKYGLKNIECTRNSCNKMKITFNSLRESNPGEYIEKTLEITNPITKSNSYINYMYSNTKVTSQEKATTMTRKIPDNAIFNDGNEGSIKIITKTHVSGKQIKEIKIPLMNEKGIVYDINIYGVIEG